MELLGTFQKPSTPPRPLSPFKRHNKVVPMSSPSAEDERRLNESMSSPVIPFHCEDYAEDGRSGVSVSPGNATVITNVQVTVEQKQATTSPPGRDSPLSTSHGPLADETGAKNTVMVEVEPLYSPVLKSKKKEALSSQKKAIGAAAVAECEVASNPGASDSPSPTRLGSESPGAPPVAKITPVSTPVDDLRPHAPVASGGNISHYETMDEIDPNDVAERSRRVYVKASSGSEEDEEAAATTVAQESKRGKGKVSSGGRKADKKAKAKFDHAPAVMLDSLASDMHVLHYAAIKGSKKEMTEILAKMKVDGVSVDLKDSEGRTALMHAVHCEHTSCIKLLVDHGANVNLPAFGELQLKCTYVRMYVCSAVHGDMLCTV